MTAAKKVKFYSTDPEKNPVVAVPIFVPESGEYEVMEFEDGEFETSNPLYIAELERCAALPAHPVSADPPKKGAKP